MLEYLYIAINKSVKENKELNVNGMIFTSTQAIRLTEELTEAMGNSVALQYIKENT
tara:strand:- start:2528 stop:2695 length:168 start_codon:yes stop_codon:yes gene_type:complete